MSDDPEIESLANEMVAGTAELVLAQSLAHLAAILAPGCDNGECRCNWCGGLEVRPFDSKHYNHEADCPWPKARAFLDSLK